VGEPHFWILRLGEMTLKSRPVRRHFQRCLEQCLLDLALTADIDLHIEHSGSLIIVSSHSEISEVENVLSHCFGLQSVERTIPCPADPESVASIALKIDEKFGTERTFGVQTKRSGNKGEWGSQDFSGNVGHHMLEKDSALSVNLSNPDYPVRIILTRENAWLLSKKIICPGGLPVGVQGLVMAKISNEIDMMGSWQMMRRGCRIVAHESSDNNLIQILSKWDSTILDPEKSRKSRSGPGRGHSRIWGIIGDVRANELSVEEESKTPISILEPMCGWTSTELSALGKHIRDPIKSMRPGYDNEILTAWIA